MKKPLQVGDRVRVYHGVDVFKGEVQGLSDCNKRVYVVEDGFYSCHRDAPFHRKQCRLLPRPREIWVEFTRRISIEEEDGTDHSGYCASFTKTPDAVRFVEAKEQE